MSVPNVRAFVLVMQHVRTCTRHTSANVYLVTEGLVVKVLWLWLHVIHTVNVIKVFLFGLECKIQKRTPDANCANVHQTQLPKMHCPGLCQHHIYNNREVICLPCKL